MKGIQGRRRGAPLRRSGVGDADATLGEGEATADERRLRQASEQ